MRTAPAGTDFDDSIFNMLRKPFVALLLLSVMYSMSFSVTGQTIKRPDDKNDPTSVDERRMTDNSSPTTLTITELDAEAMRALIGRKNDHRGRAKPLLIYLWYTDCGPCQAHFKDVARLWYEYQGRGLDIVAVAISPMDDKEKLTRYFGATPPQVPIYLLKELDDELAEDIFQKDWEVTVPSVFGYDVNGRMVVMLTQIDGDYYAGLKKAADGLFAPLPH